MLTHHSLLQRVINGVVNSKKMEQQKNLGTEIALLSSLPRIFSIAPIQSRRLLCTPSLIIFRANTIGHSNLSHTFKIFASTIQQRMVFNLLQPPRNFAAPQVRALSMQKIAHSTVFYLLSNRPNYDTSLCLHLKKYVALDKNSSHL